MTKAPPDQLVAMLAMFVLLLCGVVALTSGFYLAADVQALIDSKAFAFPGNAPVNAVTGRLAASDLSNFTVGFIGILICLKTTRAEDAEAESMGSPSPSAASPSGDPTPPR
jgi:hypothetical protein